ncbi:hypothetical protein GOBAR_AA35275 [Gossypium barbadense]|uniref:Uncharacterized protein n=1 Tax=Gossypium barbadense TaxID=3634 RepID=A0A2P5W2U3_GOSBA|nr:hypothetical protein GOBAR_AA35275 [Gossypium barbadense]
MPNAMKFLKELLANKRKLDEASHVELNAEISLKDVYEPLLNNSRGSIHEERRLQVGDKVLLDAADPHIVTTTLNEEIPLTVLSIFPFGTVEIAKGVGEANNARHGRATRALFNVVLRGKKIAIPASKKRKGASSSTALLTIDPWKLFFGIIEPTYLELTRELCSTFHLQTAYIRRSSKRRMNYMLLVATYISPSKCWHTLGPSAASYNPSRSKESIFPPSLRYLHAILAHTITGRRESTGVVNTHDAYFLWYMLHEHVIDLAYFISLVI